MNRTLLISVAAASVLLTSGAYANLESSIPYRDEYRDVPPVDTNTEYTASYEYADVLTVDPIIERVEVPMCRRSWVASSVASSETSLAVAVARMS